jgi:metal-responsive CopG/Arc/MetJ family transcriptional regulator
MKTAISLPNDLFVLADEFARSRGISRSELYAIAVCEYIQSHAHIDLTERVNAACATLETQLPADIADTTRRTLLEAEW